MFKDAEKSTQNEKVLESKQTQSDDINRECSKVPRLLEKNQPSTNFSFPMSNKRKCNSAWFSKYSWLHYDVERDCVLCFSCIKAINMIDTSSNISGFDRKVEGAFITTGFRNWKKAIEKFNDHQKSQFHSKNVNILFHRENSRPVLNQLESAKLMEEQNARKCLLIIISTLRYLMRSGSAIRGNEHEGGNFMELLEERKLDVPELESWLSRKTSYTSMDIQNELIQIMGHTLLRNIANAVRDAPFFAIIADGTTDIEGKEQFSVCLRYVGFQDLEVREVFVGFYNTGDTTGKTLASAIKDVLLRLGISLSNLRGQCYDAGANMSGHVKGVRKELADEQPKCMYVHCANHAADLALQDVAKKTAGICDLLCLVKDSSNCILRSAKRQTIYADIVLSPCTVNEMEQLEPQKLIPLCPTRWCVKPKSLLRYKQEYQRVRQTLQAILEETTLTPEQNGTIRGYLKKLKSFKTMFYLIVSIEIFSPCTTLAKALQNPKLTATGAKQAARILIQRLEDLRTDEQFQKMFDEADEIGAKLNLEYPSEPRKNKIPRRLEHCDRPMNNIHFSVKHKLKLNFFEALDRLTNELRSRFDQESMNALESFEKLLLEAYQGDVPSEENLKLTLGQHASDFDIDDLYTQLKMLKNLPGKKPSNCTEILNQFRDFTDVTKNLLKEVLKFVILIMTVPTSAATSERSFSALRRLKTYLRQRMTQKRLNHVSVLHIHKEMTAKLNLNDIMREFISRNNRKITFGTCK